MGTILTSYGDAAYEHEGYAAQVLDDGTLTGTYSDTTEARMVGLVVAACVCGWAGSTRYPTISGPFDEAAHELALTEWEREHARPTLEARRAVLWDQLCAALRRLSTGPATGGAMPGEQFITLPRAGQLHLLEATVRALDGATELSRRLRDPLEDQ